MVPTLFGDRENLIQQGKELFFTRLGFSDIPWQNAKDWLVFLHKQTEIDPRIIYSSILLLNDILMNKERVGLENTYLLIMAFPKEFQAYSVLRKFKPDYMDGKNKRLSHFLRSLTEKQHRESLSYRNSFTAVRVLSK